MITYQQILGIPKHQLVRKSVSIVPMRSAEHLKIALSVVVVHSTFYPSQQLWHVCQRSNYLDRDADKSVELPLWIFILHVNLTLKLKKNFFVF